MSSVGLASFSPKACPVRKPMSEIRLKRNPNGWDGPRTVPFRPKSSHAVCDRLQWLAAYFEGLAWNFSRQVSEQK